MLHGRRKGKKLRVTQAGLMTALLPQLAVSVSSDIGDPASLFPAKPHEIWLEIGFGGGEHLLHQAMCHPAIGFLGCEPFVNGAAKLLVTVSEADLANIRLHIGDAGELVDRLPRACISMIYLLYPDPWPKRRQRKRRFVSDGMLQRLARILKPGGQFRFATDIDDYAGWTLDRVLQCPEFAWNPATSADWLTPWPDWPGTRYEAKAVEAGRPRCYLTFVRA